jgi:hypothetical protein
MDLLVRQKANEPVEKALVLDEDPFNSWLGAVARVRGLRHVYRFLLAADKPYLPGAYLLVVVAAATVLLQIDKLLHAMHPAGGTAYGVSDLGPFVGGPDPSDVTGTWDVWSATASGPHADPYWLVGWYLGIDAVVLVPFYSLLLAVLLSRAHRRHVDRHDASPNRIVQLRWIAVAFYAVPILWLADWAENLFQGLVATGAAELSPLASAFTYLKLSLLALIVFVIVLAWIGVAWWSYDRSGDWRPDWLNELLLYRVQIVVVLAFGLLLVGPGPLGNQSLDVIRWMTDRYELIVIPVFLLALFTVMLAASCRRTLEARKAGPTRHIPDSRWFRITVLVVSGLAFVVLFLLCIKPWTFRIPPIGLIVPLGITFVVALLSMLATGAESQQAPAIETRTFVSRSIVAAPLVIFGVAAMKAATGDVFYSGGARPIVLLAAVGAPLLAVGGVAYVFADDLAASALGPIAVWGGGIVGALFFFGSVFDPFTTTDWSDGAISVTVAALLAATFLGLWLAVLGERVPVPPIFALLRFRRIPVLTLLVIWFFVASAINQSGTHPVRVLPDRSGSPFVYNLESAFRGWTETSRTSVAGGARRIQPLVLVSAEGGGIRAAYWTALVLDRLANRCATPPCLDPRSIFAVSGASGGSLGLVEYVTQREDTPGAGAGWVEQRLGADFLGPTFARMLFVDAPNAFIQGRLWDDRAAIMEQSWERAWPSSHGYLGEGLYQRGKRFPILMLNGTSVTDGCRFMTSTLAGAAGDPLLVRDPRRQRPPSPGSAPQKQSLVSSCSSPVPFDVQTKEIGDLGNLEKRALKYIPPAWRRNWVFAGTKDIVDFLCPDQDVRLSTAALLSARFPFVAPSGKIGCSSYDNDPSYVVDGGYFDNTAVSSMTELWTGLQPLVDRWNRENTNEPCVVPFLVEIDNHYSEPSAPAAGSRPKELLVPLKTLGKVRDGREANSSLAGALEFSRGDRVAYVYPRSHPGTEAPLGWTLSATSRRDLESQLDSGDVRAELTKVGNFFRGHFRDCSGGQLKVSAQPRK